MLNGKYESETVSEFKKIIEPGMIVLDIGAHIGYFTDLFSKLAGTTGTVYAFEADKENYGILEKNMENRSNVRIYNRAVTDHVGEIDFYRTVDKSGSHSTVSSDARPEKVSVRAETLDNFVRKNYIKHIDVIKMDIEGGEPAALKGMRQVLTQNHKLQMVMEFSPVNLREAGTDPADVLQILNGYGFSVKAIRQEGNYFVTADSIPEIERMRNGYVNVLLFKARHED